MTIECSQSVLSIVETKGVFLMPEQSGHHQLIFKDLAERIKNIRKDYDVVIDIMEDKYV